MVRLTMNNEYNIKEPYIGSFSWGIGLMDRVPASDAGGPGSIPGCPTNIQRGKEERYEEMY